MNLLAEALTGLGQRGEAAQMSREALAASELGDEHPLTVKLLLAAARHSAAAGQLDVGRALAERPSRRRPWRSATTTRTR